MRAKSRQLTKSNTLVDTHVLAVWNLRVWVTEEKGQFFAQGLEVDYAAQGSSLEEVMKIFGEGFSRSIDAHIREFGNIAQFLKPVSAEVMMDFNARKGDLKPIDCISVSLHVHPAKKSETAANIEFYELPKAA